jgi:transposase
MEDSKRARRRRHGAELKAQVLSECAEPGASVAKVALAHGLNANLVHKWRRQTFGAGTMVRRACEAAFVQLPIAAPAAPAVADIRIELRRGATAINVVWPAAAATECAAWLRELLK